MKCDRCGFENYDEAYACRSCGAKLSKSKQKRVRSSPAQEHNEFLYGSSQKQPDNTYNNGYSQVNDPFNQAQYQQQYNYNNSYTDNPPYQSPPVNNYSDNQQQYNYNNSYNNNSYNEPEQQSDYNNSYNNHNFQDIPADDKVYVRNFTNTKVRGNKTFRTETRQYVTSRRVSGNSIDSVDMDKDSELYQMFEDLKKEAEHQQQYNTPYNNSSYNTQYNNTPYNNSSYSSSYNTPHKNYNKSKSSIVKLVSAIVTIFMAAMILLIVYSLWDTVKEAVNIDNFSINTSIPTEPESEINDHSMELSDLPHQIADNDDHSLCIEFSVPSAYQTSMNLDDLSTINVEKYSSDSELLVDATVSIVSDDTEANIDIIKDLYISNGLQEISKGTEEVDLGTLTILSVYTNDEVFYYGLIDLDDDHCLKIQTSYPEGGDEYKEEAKELLLVLAQTSKIAEYNEDFF